MSQYNFSIFQDFGIEYKQSRGRTLIRPEGKNRFFSITTQSAQRIINQATQNRPELLQQRFEVKEIDNILKIKFDNFDDAKSSLRTFIESKIPQDAKIFAKIIYDDGESIERVYKTVDIMFNKINQAINGYEADQEFDILEIRFIIPDANPPIPPMAMSSNAINCVIKQCYQQSHKKSVLNFPTDEFMTLDDIEALETKHKLNIYITDFFNNLWRKPTIIHPKKSSHYPTDVFIKCHDYHATQGYRIKDVAIPTEEKITSNPGDCINNFHISESTADIEYMDLQELEQLHFDFLLDGKLHNVIDNGTKIIGIITKNKHYKDIELKSFDFIDPRDWSIASYGRRIFKEAQIARGNEELLYQIPDVDVYNSIKQSQTPITFLARPEAKGNIVQIDMTRAYKKTACGDLPTSIKSIFMGFPCAPRSVKTINQDLDLKLIGELNNLGLGFALVEFNQEAIIAQDKIPMMNTGQPHPTGTTVLSFPSVIYFYQYGVKFNVLQYYYNREKQPDIFSPIFGGLDLLLNKYEKETDGHKYEAVRRIPNLIIGGLNLSITKCEVFHTISREEAARFLARTDITIHRVATRDVKTPDVATCFKRQQVFYYHNTKARCTDAFNQTHLTKYITDYQKISVHRKCVEEAKQFSNVLCINTDSISYIGTSKFTPDEHWHLEAQGDRFLGQSNGCKALISNGNITYARHGGHKQPLTIDQYEVLASKFIYSIRKNKDYQIAKNYNQMLESVPIEGQELYYVFKPAGWGKSELAKYISQEPSRFSIQTNDVKTYDDIIQVGTTHVARKLINGSFTVAGLITRLYKGIITAPKCVLIDECSMLTSDDLKSLDKALRVSGLNRPFGGVSIILMGHMKQLPPVHDDKLLLSSELFQLFTDRSDLLTKNHRQDTDRKYATILDKIEAYYEYGGDDKSQQKAKRVLPKILTPDEIKYLRTRVVDTRVEGTKILHYKNNLVNRDNNRYGKWLAGEEVIFRETFNRTVNKEQYNFYNGDHYYIEEVEGKDEKMRIKVNGVWFSHKYLVPDPKNKEQKYPRIQLAAAMTIHCSQGQTLDSIFIHLNGLTMNLLYVAMSRVRTVNDLYLANCC